MEIAEKAIPGSPLQQQKDWSVLFCSPDPSIWNSDLNRGPEDFALSLAHAPQNITYLRMRSVQRNASVIISMEGQTLAANNWTANENLVMNKVKGPVWYGERRLTKTAYHIGIIDARFKVPPGIPVINLWGAGLRCYGFGHRHMGERGQDYVWEGRKLPRSAFEISVTTSESLSEQDRQLLLK